MNFRRTRRSDPQIELTPLIDVVFQLLLFFMLSTTFRNSPNFDVQLPEVSSDKFVQEDNSWTVVVSMDGDLSVLGEAVSVEEFGQKIRSAIQDNPNLSLVIEADERLTHGKVVQLMDAAQEAGVSTIQIGASQK